MHCNKSTWLCFTVSYIYSLLVLTELCLLLSQWVLVALLMWRETTGGCGPPASVYHCFRDVCELQSKRSFRVLALVFFFLSGTGTAHLHSTNILPIALRVRNMLLVCFQLGDPLAPFRNPYCIPESKRHTALHCTALLWQHLQLSDCKTWKLHRAYGIFRKAEVLQD